MAARSERGRLSTLGRAPAIGERVPERDAEAPGSRATVRSVSRPAASVGGGGRADLRRSPLHVRQHFPIDRLICSFDDLVNSLLAILSDLSADERSALLRLRDPSVRTVVVVILRLLARDLGDASQLRAPDYERAVVVANRDSFVGKDDKHQQSLANSVARARRRLLVPCGRLMPGAVALAPRAERAPPIGSSVERAALDRGSRSVDETTCFAIPPEEM
jgi:hypothetical protein